MLIIWTIFDYLINCWPADWYRCG